jgi:Gas vesicle protein G
VGLVGSLLSLPLAPLHGVLWIAGHIQEQVNAEADPVAAIRRQLTQLESALAAGEISEDECADQQDVLLERLLELATAPIDEPAAR